MATNKQQWLTPCLLLLYNHARYYQFFRSSHCKKFVELAIIFVYFCDLLSVKLFGCKTRDHICLLLLLFVSETRENRSQKYLVSVTWVHQILVAHNGKVIKLLSGSDFATYHPAAHSLNSKHNISDSSKYRFTLN